MANRPVVLEHATTLTQYFLPRGAANELDHVILGPLSAQAFLNIWVVNENIVGTPSEVVGDRYDRVPVGPNTAHSIIPLGTPVGDPQDATGHDVGGVVISLSSGADATGDLPAAVRATYRWGE